MIAFAGGFSLGLVAGLALGVLSLGLLILAWARSTFDA